MALSTALRSDIDRDFVSRRPNYPIRLAEFTAANLADLDPAAYPSCVVVVSDKGCLAFSTGAAWVRSDGSAI